MPSYFSYTALSQDTFDSIALDFYNKEMLTAPIISANPHYRNTVLFKGGEVLRIPIIEPRAADSLPPWKRL